MELTMISGKLRAGALCAAVALGALGAGIAPASAHYVTTRCDRDGDDCYRVVCDDDGDDCHRLYGYGYYHHYYRPRYYRYGYSYGYARPSYNFGVSIGNGYYGDWHHEHEEDDDD
jgi:hypothetical protein